ncbi:sirohydrochlorin cobaltochelatase [Slackia heliotrinireducens]|jgi:sirohydrochlorin cobaltochelatase|uniref:sirohydrochlorin cobaltochelatase n=1 Tax=Slackia heliotrinireducens TaxID=84110 RepID=UPI00331615F1
MNKALLVVSFGTSAPGVAERTIGAVERALAQAMPERAFYSCWTSRVICAKVERETGVHHMQLAEALDAMATAGVSDVLVQPTHLMQGRENRVMLETLREHAGDFDRICLGNTLLTCDDDCTALARAICSVFAEMRGGDALVLMGHGSAFGGNEAFSRMQQAFGRVGQDDVVVATVEGEPSFADALAFVEARKPSRIWLAPLMMVAGDHAQNDMAGSDPDSWASQLAARGYEVLPVLRGLGEYPEVQSLFVKHAQCAYLLERS